MCVFVCVHRWSVRKPSPRRWCSHQVHEGEPGVCPTPWMPSCWGWACWVSRTHIRLHNNTHTRICKYPNKWFIYILYIIYPFKIMLKRSIKQQFRHKILFIHFIYKVVNKNIKCKLFRFFFWERWLWRKCQTCTPFSHQFLPSKKINLCKLPSRYAAPLGGRCP